MDIEAFHSIWTVLMAIVFVGILVWAWSGKRRDSFAKAAQMPLEDDDAPGRADNARSGSR